MHSLNFPIVSIADGQNTKLDISIPHGTACGILREQCSLVEPAGSSTHPLNQIKKAPMRVRSVCRPVVSKRRDCSAFALRPRNPHPCGTACGILREQCSLVEPAGSSTHPLNQIKKGTHAGAPFNLAERVGFEPTVRGYRTPDFESGTFDHSATSPKGAHSTSNRRFGAE